MTIQTKMRSVVGRDGKLTFLPDGDEVLKDGEHLHTPVNFMDSHPAMHAPGFVTDSDANAQRRATQVDAYDKRISDAWKAPPVIYGEAHAEKLPSNKPTSLEDAYRLRDAALENAWRS